MRLGLALLALAAIAGVAHAADAPASVRVVDDAQEGEPSYHFEPARVEVAAGAAFTFRGGAKEPHTLTHDAAPGSRAFDSDNVDPGASATLTAPTTPGEYAFKCLYHPGMRGTLVVASFATTPGTTAPARVTPAPSAAVAALALVGVALTLRAARGPSRR